MCGGVCDTGDSRDSRDSRPPPSALLPGFDACIAGLQAELAPRVSRRALSVCTLQPSLLAPDPCFTKGYAVKLEKFTITGLLQVPVKLAYVVITHALGTRALDLDVVAQKRIFSELRWICERNKTRLSNTAPAAQTAAGTRRLQREERAACAPAHGCRA